MSTTLIGQDKKTALKAELIGYKLANGDMLLIGKTRELSRVAKFLAKNELSGIYFNEVQFNGGEGFREYNGFLEMSAVTGVTHGILVFK